MEPVVEPEVVFQLWARWRRLSVILVLHRPASTKRLGTAPSRERVNSTGQGGVEQSGPWPRASSRACHAGLELPSCQSRCSKCTAPLVWGPDAARTPSAITRRLRAGAGPRVDGPHPRRASGAPASGLSGFPIFPPDRPHPPDPGHNSICREFGQPGDGRRLTPICRFRSTTRTWPTSNNRYRWAMTAILAVADAHPQTRSSRPMASSYSQLHRFPHPSPLPSHWP